MLKTYELVGQASVVPAEPGGAPTGSPESVTKERPQADGSKERSFEIPADSRYNYYRGILHPQSVAVLCF